MYHHSNPCSNKIRSGIVTTLSGKSNKHYTCYAPPLVWASELGLTSIVRQLLNDPSVNVNEPGVANVSELAISSKKQHLDIMELLLAHGGDVSDFHDEEDSKQYELSRSALYNAARFGHSKALKILLRDHSRFGKPGWILEVALEHAAYSRTGAEADCVGQLIDAGAKVNARSRVSGNAFR